MKNHTILERCMYMKRFAPFLFSLFTLIRIGNFKKIIIENRNCASANLKLGKSFRIMNWQKKHHLTNITFYTVN